MHVRMHISMYLDYPQMNTGVHSADRQKHAHKANVETIHAQTTLLDFNVNQVHTAMEYSTDQSQTTVFIRYLMKTQNQTDKTLEDFGTSLMLVHYVHPTANALQETHAH